MLVLSSGRSGSTLLVNSLAFHPRISIQGELLEEEATKTLPKDPSRLLTYIQASLFTIRNLFAFDAWPFVAYSGFKIFNEQLERTGIALPSLIDAMNRPKVIVLYRRSLLETFVSLENAFRTKEWFRAPDDPLVRKAKPLHVDWDRFVEFATTERRRWSTSLRALNACPVDKLFVSFEDLVENQDNELARIFSHLHLEPCEVGVVSVRQNPGRLCDKVANFDEIRRRMDDERDLYELAF